MPHRRTGILGVFQKSIEMTFILKALRVCQHPGHHAAHGIRHRHGGNLSTGEDEVT